MKWKFETAKGVHSSPAIGSDGTIYVGSYDNKLYAINPDGTEKWNFITDLYVYSSPAIGSDGTIYVGSQDNNLYAINPDGTEKWNFRTGNIVVSSPAIGYDGVVYVGSDDFKLYAIYPDGSEKWNFTTRGDVMSSPAIDSNGTIYVGSQDHKLYAINPDGSRKWRFKTGANVDTAPAIGSDGTIYVGSKDNKLYAIYPNGSEKWSFTTGFGVHSPSIDYDGTIYVGSSDNKLYAINPDGSEKWNFTTGWDVASSPAISSDGTIYVGSSDNKLYAINPDGSEKWNFITYSDVRSSPAIGSDGTIYVGSADGNLYAIGITPVPPIANAGPDQTKNEGDVVLLDGSSSYDHGGSIESYKWDFESDGIYDYQETPSNASDGAFDGITNHVYGDDGIFKATLRVTNNQNLTDTDTCNITVNNVVPTMETIIAQNAIEVTQKWTEEWVARYNGPGNDYDGSNAIAVDSIGNVYVTGMSTRYTGVIPMIHSDYVTVKYDSNGKELWVAEYNGPGNGNDEATKIAIDSVGNIYVTGESKGNGTSLDYATIKYDPSGNEQWIARYNGAANDIDRPKDIAIDSMGNIYVTGCSADNSGFYDYATVKYDSNGNQIWIAKYKGAAGGYDVARAIAVDSSGNVYVTGNEATKISSTPKYDYATVAYDSSGNELWFKRYNGPGNGDDVAEAIALDKSGNVFITGKGLGIGTSYDYETIKYDPLGNELWVARYNGPENDFEYAFAIATDSSGNVYVTGRENIGESANYATIAYDPSGNELWIARYDGLGNGNDCARALVIDSFGNVIVTGDSKGNGTSADIASIAYDSNGNELWVARYNGPGDSTDAGSAIATDTSGNIFVTGVSKGNETEYDFATIKYSSLNYYECSEGSSVTFTMNATDLGSDDLTFTWNWGDGTPDTVTTYYNNNAGPEPVYDPITNEVKSPWGTYPFNATDTVSHIYGDNGEYSVTLTVKDDDGGVTTFPIKVKVNNIEPTIEPFGPFNIDEDSPIDITGIASDPGSDDLTFTWTFEYGPTVTNVYYNDGAGPDPYPSPSGIFPFSGSDTVGHTYGDDGIFTVTLTVEDDDGGISVYKTNITISNVNPTVTIESINMDVEIGLRVAGRKYNNVSMALYEDGNSIGYVSIERIPGSPDEQMVWIPLSVDFTKSYSLTVTYTPEDPPNVGGNPVWIYIKSQNGSINKIHHTFNVQQSKKRDSHHWNHVEPWEVDLNGHFIGLSFEITSHITDPGSDDEILTFTYNSQVKTVTYLNNPPDPDPYPSPDINPVDILDTTTLIYEGPGTVYLDIIDDDGGTESDSLVL